MVKPHQAVNLDRPLFTGEHVDLLNQLYELVLRSWEDHYTSPIFAGDEMIFTLGGNGYMVVFSHLGFGGLVEGRTPEGGFDLRPDPASRTVSIAKVDSPEDASTRSLLERLIHGLEDYYERGPQLRV